MKVSTVLIGIKERIFLLGYKHDFKAIFWSAVPIVTFDNFLFIKK
jgi:hypothetical protein